jgi:hypothetical protein
MGSTFECTEERLQRSGKHGEVITQDGTDQVKMLKDKVRRLQVKLERLPGDSYVTDRPESAAGGLCVSPKGS